QVDRGGPARCPDSVFDRSDRPFRPGRAGRGRRWLLPCQPRAAAAGASGGVAPGSYTVLGHPPGLRFLRLPRYPFRDLPGGKSLKTRPDRSVTIRVSTPVEMDFAERGVRPHVE